MSVDKRRKPNIIRVGDQVRITASRKVVRVGYPKGFADYEKEARGLFDKLVPTLKSEGISVFPLSGFTFKVEPRTRFERKVLHELQFYLAEQDGFGGRTRSVHFEPHTFADTPHFVREVAMRMTGEYYPASSSRDWETGVVDGEPGGLTNAKPVRLLLVTEGSHDFIGFDEGAKKFTTGTWVLAGDCVKIA